MECGNQRQRLSPRILVLEVPALKIGACPIYAVKKSHHDFHPHIQFSLNVGILYGHGGAVTGKLCVRTIQGRASIRRAKKEIRRSPLNRIPDVEVDAIACRRLPTIQAFYEREEEKDFWGMEKRTWNSTKTTLSDEDRAVLLFFILQDHPDKKRIRTRPQ